MVLLIGRRKLELWIFFEYVTRLQYTNSSSMVPLPLCETSLIVFRFPLFFQKFKNHLSEKYNPLWPSLAGNDVDIMDSQPWSKILKAGTIFISPRFCKMSTTYEGLLWMLDNISAVWMKESNIILLTMAFWGTCSKSFSTL